ncbi:type I DNA topoisomerase [Helicovermis profundi]|uniref:DNA topoisomerase 1 n=1 Tax=Helicovermis profundi TaxID=3065157 RepID=A0AAU9EF65_9FIRM|nr:type I DNA topoisomerase [Clostridia bacterium S502]
MGKYLVIVESPAKAKTIEKFLGKNYTVKASVGHVRDLPKSKMGIDIENDFEPNYITIRGKGPVVKELRKAAKKAEKIFLATDPDREGEAIAWHLSFMLGIDIKEKCRVEFHEITKDAIRAAIKKPKEINMKLVDAQQARRILDRLVGYSISPILWNKVKKGLSAGRVQSVATKLIVDREESIKAFNSEEYWSVHASLLNKLSELSVYDLALKNNKKIEIKSIEEAENIKKDISENDFIVESVEKKVKKRSPYACFTTSSLQQEAANRYGFSTKKTMIIAQQLYEGINIKKNGTIGLITYMRTDSTRISNEAKEELSSFIVENLSEDYLKKSVKKTTKKKTTQDAHEAIRPTSVLRIPLEIEGSLSKDQYKLYKLIWERFVASQMADALYDSISVKVKNGEYLFKSSGSKLKFDGFLKIYSYSATKDKEIAEVQVNEKLKSKNIDLDQHFTQPPARYTEASLVKYMEENGIGRPSTYAPTIGTIIGRGYIEREKKSLKPTELAYIINEIIVNYFTSIVSVDFTASLENNLDNVENDELEWKSIIRDFYSPFKEMLEHADKELDKIDLTEETDIVCEKCGAFMNIKHGRYGKFLACSNYPECSNTKAILKEIGVHCPKCESGQVVERKTRKYKTFYGCSTFPDCNFVSWNRPIGRLCPICSDVLVERKTKKIHRIECANKECKYIEEINNDEKQEA